jgi:hypothetical protein
VLKCEERELKRSYDRNKQWINNNGVQRSFCPMVKALVYPLVWSVELVKVISSVAIHRLGKNWEMRNWDSDRF